MTKTVLDVQDVSYSYGRSDWKLDEVSLSVQPGDFIGIIGANGSGKSTLLKIAAGILRSNSGSVLLENKAIERIPRRKLAQRLGYLPQQISPVFDYSVEEIVSMGRFCHSQGLGLTTSQDQRIVEHCMEETEISPLRHRTIDELSGGERQRVMLTSVLAQQPAIMLLDEPVVGLDLHHQVAFFKLLAQFSARGMAVLVITHDLNLASQFCSKILLLDQGRMQIMNSVENVFEQIQTQKIYSDDICILRHPNNQKPAVLPFNSVSNTGDQR